MTPKQDAFVGRILDFLAGIGFLVSCVGVYALMCYLGF